MFPGERVSEMRIQVFKLFITAIFTIFAVMALADFTSAEDETSPEIEFIYPQDETEEFPVDNDLRISFSEKMNTSHAEENLLVDFEHNVVWIYYNGSHDSAMIIKPTDNLLFGTDYTLDFNEYPKDAAGNHLEDWDKIDFRTEELFVNIFKPGNEDVVSGEVEIAGNASPLADIVEIRYNGKWHKVDEFEHGYAGSGNWTYNFNSTIVPDGELSVTARSVSGDQYSSIKTINLIISNNVPPEVKKLELSKDEYEPGDTAEVTAEVTDDNGIWNIQTLTLYLYDGDGNELDNVFIEVNQTIEYEYELNELSKGEYEFKLAAADNQSETDEKFVTFEISNSKPKIEQFHLNKEKVTQGKFFTITAEISDFDGIEDIDKAILEIQDSSGTLEHTETLKPNDRIVHSYKAKLSSGDYLVKIIIQDKSGEEATEFTSIKIKEKEDESDPEIAGMNAYYVAPGIGVAALLAALGGFLLYKRKQESSETKFAGKQWGRSPVKRSRRRPAKPRHICPKCKGPVKHLKDRDKWVCDRCKKFVNPLLVKPKPEARPKPGRKPRPKPSECPSCGGDSLKFSGEYKDFYCWDCEEYIRDMD